MTSPKPRKREDDAWICEDHCSQNGRCCELGKRYIPASEVARLVEAAKATADYIHKSEGHCWCYGGHDHDALCAEMRSALAAFADEET
jgi:hypothetical protein